MRSVQNNSYGFGFFLTWQKKTTEVKINRMTIKGLLLGNQSVSRYNNGQDEWQHWRMWKWILFRHLGQKLPTAAVRNFWGIPNNSEFGGSSWGGCPDVRKEWLSLQLRNQDQPLGTWLLCQVTDLRMTLQLRLKSNFSLMLFSENQTSRFHRRQRLDRWVFGKYCFYPLVIKLEVSFESLAISIISHISLYQQCRI